MKKDIAPKDWEALSAHLDGVLSPDEASKLSARLESETELQFALDQMRATQELLRSLPQAKRRKHFTLTEEMVGNRRFQLMRSRFSWNMASAVATAMLLFVIIGDVLTFGLPSFGADQAMPEAAVAIEAVEMAVPAADSAAEGMAAESEDDLLKEAELAEARNADEEEITPMLSGGEEDGLLEEEFDQNERIFTSRNFRGAEIVLAAIAGISAILGWRAIRTKGKYEN